MGEDEYLTPRQRRFLEDNPGAELSSQVETRELIGVAGWLGFLVAALLVLGPLFTVALTAAELSNARAVYPELAGTTLWEDVQLITWVTVVIFCIVSVYAGLRLLRKHVPSSVGIAIICLWLAGPLLGIATLIALDEIGAEPTASDVGAVIGKPLIWATIWTVYLLVSKRVRNTYFGGRKPGQVAAERWRLSKRGRQLAFFSVSWVILSFLYFQLVAPLDYPDPSEVRRMWAVIILPPILFAVGTWAYRKFVDVDD